jgi:hypothetical protein
MLFRYYSLGSLDLFFDDKKIKSKKTLALKFIVDIAKALLEMKKRNLCHCGQIFWLISILKQRIFDRFWYCAILSESAVDANMFAITNTRGLSVPHASREPFIRSRKKLEGVKLKISILLLLPCLK